MMDVLAFVDRHSARRSAINNTECWLPLQRYCTPSLKFHNGITVVNWFAGRWWPGQWTFRSLLPFTPTMLLLN